MSEINYSLIESVFGSMSYDDFINEYEDLVCSLNPKTLKLLKRYFGVVDRTSYHIDDIEKIITLIVNGLYKKGTHVSLNKLYEVYLKNIDEFTMEQQYVCECLIFKKRPKKELRTQFPNLKKYNVSSIICRLERIYYVIDNSMDRNFPLEKYLLVRDRLSDEDKNILDMYYGYRVDKKSISELASMLNCSYADANALYRGKKIKAMNLYIDKKSAVIRFDKEIYIEFLKNNFIPLNEERVNVFKMFLDGMSYDEISLKTGLDNTKISNYVTDCVRRIDYYRFGIDDELSTTYLELEEYYKWTNRTYEEYEKKAVELKFVRHLSNKEVMSELNIDSKDIKRIFAKFSNDIFKYRIKDVVVDDDFIRKEVMKHYTENVLSDKEILVLSYLYGIKCDCNPEGIKLKSTEIQKKFGISIQYFSMYMRTAIAKIKGVKIGVVRKEGVYVSREEIENLFISDLGVPITDKEYEIICSTLELEGYCYRSFQELAILYNETPGNISLRYKRAILSIKRYLNGELGPKIVYERDIQPYLRYFCLLDRNLIIDRYSNEYTYEEIGKKYNMSCERVTSMMNRINYLLFDMRNDSSLKRFDFIFYEENINNPDLPYYGDLELAKKIFNLYIGLDGEELTASEILEKLKLGTSLSTVNRIISNFMLSFSKLKDGIVKTMEYSYDEILDYYNKNKDNMTNKHRRMYERYLSLKENNLLSYNSLVPFSITWDLIKASENGYYDLKSKSQEDIKELLSMYGKKLPKELRNQLCAIYGINAREYMSGKEVNHVYRILYKLFGLKNDKKNNNELSLRKDN